MLIEAKFEDDFNQIYNQNKRPVIVYGAGKGFLKRKNYIHRIDMICDKNYGLYGKLDGLVVQPPESMKVFEEPVYIIIAVRRKTLYHDVLCEIKKYNLEGMVFHLYQNISFGDSYWENEKDFSLDNSRQLRSINLVCRDTDWILHKFAERMKDILIDKGYDARITADTTESADINHHIIYSSYKAYENDTIMITHINNMYAFEFLKRQLRTAGMGICMSRETMNQLIGMGAPRNKLCYINPAHDHVIVPRKRVVGITHRCYEHIDTRKRTAALLDIIDGVNPDCFRFAIMGSGWQKIIEVLKARGFETTYYPEFDYERYVSLVPTFDYYLFMGFDEGSMGYLDAMAAGVKTIVTPQGFHMDNGFPIDYPCRTVEEFRNAFLDIQKKVEARRQSVESWTWKSYTEKHIEIWKYLLHAEPLTKLTENQLFYQDGIFSVLMNDNRV